MSSFLDIIKEVYAATKDIKEGKNADYIPQLAEINPELYGVAFCDKDGNIFGVGDCEKQFCLQSCVKPFNYCLARTQEEGDENMPIVHDHVGFEPSGVKFNAFVMNNEGLPHNPLINSGAIMTASLIEPRKEPSHRFRTIQQFICKLSGMGDSAVGFDNTVFLSEKVHADRNISLAYYMRENKAFFDHPTQSQLDEHLNLYFQTCSLTCNARALSAIAATLAFHGKSPVSNEQVVAPNIVMDSLSIMYMCGMYDFSGQFAFNIGLPAKSGVAGAIMVVIPNVGGLCIWSPPLDPCGNSVRGLEFCRLFTERTEHKYHIFRSMRSEAEDNREDTFSGIQTVETLTHRLIHASATGDIESVRDLVEHGLKKFRKEGESDNAASRRLLSIGDYDKRTCLHLAAAEGHSNVVRILIECGVQTDVQDRWGVTPLHEVRKHIKQLNRENADSEEYNNYMEIASMLVDTDTEAAMMLGSVEANDPLADHSRHDQSKHSAPFRLRTNSNAEHVDEASNHESSNPLRREPAVIARAAPIKATPDKTNLMKPSPNGVWEFGE